MISIARDLPPQIKDLLSTNGIDPDRVTAVGFTWSVDDLAALEVKLACVAEMVPVNLAYPLGARNVIS
jgi:hypothetical protein